MKFSERLKKSKQELQSYEQTATTDFFKEVKKTGGRRAYISLFVDAKRIGDPEEIGNILGNMTMSAYAKGYLGYNESLIFYLRYSIPEIISPSDIESISTRIDCYPTSRNTEYFVIINLKNTPGLTHKRLTITATDENCMNKLYEILYMLYIENITLNGTQGDGNEILGTN